MATQSLLTSLIVSSWINVFLYSTEVTLGVYFFSHHKHNRIQKFSLGGSMLLDAICTGVVCYSVWVFTDPSLKIGLTWWQAVITMLTYLVSVLEQLYLVHRYWIIARNKIVVSLVLLGALVHPVFAFISSIYVLVIPQSMSRSAHNNFGATSVTIAAVICAATDMLIAINMFRAIRKVDTVQDSTQSLLYRLSIFAISSGVLTATATIIKIILLFVSIRGFAFMFNVAGRIYTLTIVVNCIALKRYKRTTTVFASGSETRTSRTSRSPGSVMSTSLHLPTLTIPEDVETNSCQFKEESEVARTAEMGASHNAD